MGRHTDDANMALNCSGLVDAWMLGETSERGGVGAG